MPKIRFSATSLLSINRAILELEKYKNDVKSFGDRIVQELAKRGYDAIYTVLANHVWSGETINSLRVEDAGNGKMVISAESKALLFLEFGAGIHYAFANGGHPLADQLGFGVGTHPGQKHAYDEKGWWFPTDDPSLAIVHDKNGQGWAHSYGTPPYRPFYDASVSLRMMVLDVAREVFNSDRH